MPDLAELSEHYPLRNELVDQFRKNGHVVLRRVASQQVLDRFRPGIVEAVEAFAKSARPLQERDSYHRAFLQVANLWESHPEVRPFVLAHRFARIAAELMGVKAVRLWHDQALFKEPGGGPTPWHQDAYYWPLDTNNTVTMWMPLVDVPLEMGPLAFASGSQRHGALAAMAISDASDQFFDKWIVRNGLKTARCALDAGDATFHYGWTLHHAMANATDRMREVFTVIYFEHGTRISEPANQHQPADLARWLPGLEPGEPAASRLNPLVYSK